MPIQVIDNFEVNTPKPIDNRFVVGTGSFYLTRFDITNTYNGLRIWDLNDGQPYVYNGVTWSSEASLTTIQGTGSAGYLPKFNTSNSLVNSAIYETSGNILIGTTSNYAGVPAGKLQVDGVIRTVNGGFYGDGANIVSINASNITSGSLSLQRLSLSGSSGWVMVRDSSTATWASSSSLIVGSASALATTRTLWGQNFNGTQNVTGNISVNGSVTNITGNIQFKNVNNGILSFYWTGTSNLNQNLKIPAYVSITGVPRTLALLEQTQTFTGINTFTNFTNFQDSIQVGGTSSFHDQVDVFVTATLNLPPPIGSINIKNNPLNVRWGGIFVGSTTSNNSPYITIAGGYTWAGDTDSGMFRVSTSGSTYSSLRMHNDGKVQMSIGNDISPTYSTSIEQYTTPGVAMMSLLDVWYISDFDSLGLIPPKFVWLNTTVNSLATSLPYTLDPAGTSGPGAAQAQAGNAATNYDRMVVISTSGRTAAYVFLETIPNSGLYYQLNFIFKDSNYPLIIPAGRKWKVMMIRASIDQVTDESSTYNVANAQSNDDKVRFVSYKWGMN